MNSMDEVRFAANARRDHVHSDRCSRDSEGHCFVLIDLWHRQNRAALRWNAPEPPPAPVTVDRAYL